MNQDPKKLLELYKPKEVKVLKPDRQMCMVRFSPCRKVLAAACHDGTVRRWDAEFAELPPLAGHGGWVQAIAFHPDGKRLFAVDSWGGLRCWPYADMDPKPTWSVDQAHDGWIRGMALSPDGEWLATCGSDAKIRLWSADQGKKLEEWTGHDDQIFAIAFHPDGKALVSGDLKGIVRQWDLTRKDAGGARAPTRELDARLLYKLDRLQDVGGVRSLTFDPKGDTLACAGTLPKNGASLQGTPTILFFDWNTGKPRNTLKVGADGDGYVCDLHFHPEAGFIMAVSSGNPGVGKFFFHQPSDNQPFFVAPIPNCHSLARHPNGMRLVISATNANSNGNGRLKGKNNDYPGNFSPLHIWDMPRPAS